MKTIVALVDLTDVSSKVLKHAETLAAAFGSKVILLHVVPPEPAVATLGAEAPSIPEPPSPETLRAEMAKLELLLQSLLGRGVNAVALQFDGPVAETVLAETQRLDADLVIMGSHHHSMLYNLFVGSVTADILKRATFPVLVLPAEVVAPKKVEPIQGTPSLSPEDIRQRQALAIQPMMPP